MSILNIWGRIVTFNYIDFFAILYWAGRSVGRSLPWHGRGRGFKSLPVHFLSSINKASLILDRVDMNVQQ